MVSELEQITTFELYLDRSKNYRGSCSKYLLRNWFGAEPDYAKQFEFFKTKATTDSNAQNNLSMMYIFGLGTPIDFKEAIKHLESSSNKKHAGALNNLGYLLHHKKVSSIKQPINFFVKSAELGSDVAKYNMAILSIYGLGIPQNLAQGIKLLEKNNDTRAKNFLGDIYACKNVTIATKWYEESANLGNAYAQNALGRFYEIENKNYTGALELYEKSANQGYKVAQYHVGLACLGGANYNEEKALKFIRQSASQNYANAQSRLGRLYSHGIGVKMDIAEAKKWYTLSANQNFCVAQYNLAVLHKQEGEFFEAFRWYIKALENGDADVQLYIDDLLGDYYDTRRATNVFTKLFNSNDNLNNELDILELENAELAYKPSDALEDYISLIKPASLKRRQSF